MRAKEAKEIKISEYLSSIGIKESHQRMGGKELWYSSPIREKDSTPSFKVDTEKNLWFDFGLDIGGNILDLVMKLQITTFKKSLQILDESELYQSTISRKQYKNISTESIQSGLADNKNNQINETNIETRKKIAGEKQKTCGFDILKVSEINSASLYDYLSLRAINLEIAKQYLKQIYYKPKGQKKGYLALGWMCGNGYEARSEFFKGFIGTKKDLIKINLKNNQTLSIFEGFMDFLSFLTYYDKNDFLNSVIILNSINFKKQALKEIEKYKFTKIYLFLDNDTAGIETKVFFQDSVRGIPLLDMSYLYQYHKDFNEMLKEKN